MLDLNTIFEQINNSYYLKDCVDTCYLESNIDKDIDEEKLTEILEQYINEYNIIYYGNAMKFLSNEDASLNESLSLASSYGFSLENLNSETLATILFQEKAREELYSLYFEELEEEEEEDDDDDEEV